jgi:hypothetical protein
MRLAVAPATERDPIPSLKTRFSQETFPNDVVSKQIVPGVAHDASAAVTKTNKMTPKSEAILQTSP